MSSKNFMSYDDAATVLGAYAEAIKSKQSLTAGDYIDITSGEISVNREIPNETVSYEFKTKGTSEPNIAIIVTKRSNGSVVWENEYQYLDVLTPIVIDDVIKFGYQWVNAGQWTYEMLVASDSHAVGYRQSWGYLETKDYTEDFSLIDNTGLKLVIKSEMDNALAGKQNALTEGDYVSINNSNIGVTLEKGQPDVYAYKFVTTSTSDYTPSVKVQKYLNGTLVSETNYENSEVRTPVEFDDRIRFWYGEGGGFVWSYRNLVASNEHVNPTTTTWAYNQTVEYEETFDVYDQSTKLATQGYVDTAMATKQDTLTFDDMPTANSNNPVKSGGVKSAIDAAVSRCYHHAGTKTCAELLPALLIAANEGNVYEMTDSGTTTSDFMEGIGRPIKEGDNVGIARVSEGVYKFDLLSGFVDTTNFVQKSQTSGLLKNDGTVNDEIEGDVDSLKSGLTTLDNEVNGDAVEYPYADVITIEDAVPANVAECSVKIEPVQDLHGYDKPWVGGAGKNKAYVNINSGETSLTEIKDNDNNVIGVNADVGAAGVVVTVKMATVSIENGKTYTLSGSPNDKSNSTYRLDVRTQAQGQLYNNWNEIDNPTITATEDVTLDIYLRIAANYAVNNLVFHPQIEEGSTTTTFAPYTNICPITGHTEASVQRDGKNLFNKSAAGIVVGKYLNSETGELVNSTNNWNTSDYIYVSGLGGESITFSGLNSIGASNFSVCYYDKNNNFISGSNGKVMTLTIPSDERIAYLRFDYRQVDADDIQLELGSTATPYVPYAGKTYTILFKDGQGNPVTAYKGGIDFNTGVMTASWAVKDMGTLSWNLHPIYQNLPRRFGVIISGIKNDSSCVCEGYKNVPVSDITLDSDFVIFGGDNYINIVDSNYDNATAFKASVDGIHCIYELATPLTIQLTPQQIQLLKGQNTLTASTGQISVTVNGVSGAIGAVQTQANDTDEALAELAADIAEQLPTAPTTDGAYVLTVTVSSGTPTYSWESAE